MIFPCPVRHNPRQQVTLFAVVELLLASLRVRQADHAAVVVIPPLPHLVARRGQPGLRDLSLSTGTGYKFRLRLLILSRYSAQQF